MNGTIRSVACALACIACAAAAAAQTPQETERQRRDARQQLRATQMAAEKKVQDARGRIAGRRGGQVEASEPFSRTVRLVNGGTFDLWNVAGDVTITGGGRETRIDAVKRVREVNDRRAQALLAGIRIEIAERGGNVEVRTVHPRTTTAGGAAVDYTITLPSNANVILRSTSGNLHVQNISGDELTANTLSGNVIISDLTTRMLELHTVLGNMQLHDVATQRALLQSMAGNLEYAGRLMRTGRYQLQTHRGDIRVIPSGDAGFDLEAMTHSGDLHSEFVLKLPPQPRPGPRRPVQRVLRGTFGDAAAALTATSFGGNIIIVKP
jgi:hypothetical protein